MRKTVLLVLILVCCLMVSCGRTEKAEESAVETEVMETTEARLVTKEELFEKTTLTPEDFEGGDVEEFIRELSITEDKIADERRLRNSLDTYLFYQEEHYYYADEYEKLFDTSYSRLEEGMLDDIKVILVQSEYQGNLSTYVFDFEENRICGGASFEYIRDLNQEDKERIIKLLKESGLEQLKRTRYFKWSPGEWSDNFEIVIVTNDGRTAHYKADEDVQEAMEKIRGKNNDTLMYIVGGIWPEEASE